MSARLRVTRLLAAAVALAVTVPGAAHGSAGPSGAYVRTNPLGVETPCFVDPAAPKLSASGLECEAAAAAPAGVLSAKCNGTYTYNYSQPQHASHSISGSASSPGATYIYLECRARWHNPPTSSAWQTVHNFTAWTNGASVGGSSFTYLPPPPVDVPSNLCYWAYANNAGTITNC